MTKQLTPTQIAGAAKQLRNTCATIEQEQGAPLDVEQACIIYDLCTAMNINPHTVLSEDNMALIDDYNIKLKPRPPLVKMLDKMPKFMQALGRVLQ